MVVGMKLKKVPVCGWCWPRTTQEVVDDVVNFREQILGIIINVYNNVTT